VGRGWAVGASGDVGSPGGLRLDLLMVRDRSTGRFVYTERLERRSGETSWEYVRRSVRRETRIRTRFDGEAMEVIVGWDVDSVEQFLRAYPEYRTDGDSNGTSGMQEHEGRMEGDAVDQ
jgi:hypothetical protein